MPLLEMRSICKSFGQNQVLKNVDFFVNTGEVSVLIGENGAGKSTLMKIISGVHSQTSGEIIFDGKKVHFHSPHDSEAAGIGIVYQELTLLPELSIAENLFLGKRLPVNKFGRVQWKKVYRDAAMLLKEYLDMDIDPKIKVSSLGIAQQQMIEIVKVVTQNVKLLILDEPTAALTSKEVEKLFEIIESLKKRNISMVYISHRMEEIFEIGDRVTVLRDGEYIGETLVKNTTYDKLVSMMVGRDLTNYYPKENFSGIEKVEKLRVEGLNRDKVFHNISFSAYSGEILGIAGLMGAGRTEIARAIFGADKLDSGKIFINGKEETIKKPQDAINKGIALLPEDRKSYGLVLDKSIAENITVANLNKVSNNLGVLNKKRELKYADQYKDDLRIVTTDIKKKSGELSGGNQQKVIIARWIFADSNIVIFDEPTRGIDVGAKIEVYKLMNKMVREGKAVIMISSEMPELLGICDRIITVSHGTITGDMPADINQEEILKCMLSGGSNK